VIFEKRYFSLELSCYRFGRRGRAKEEAADKGLESRTMTGELVKRDREGGH
jgi:hypothetical protein